MKRKTAITILITVLGTNLTLQNFNSEVFASELNDVSVVTTINESTKNSSYHDGLETSLSEMVNKTQTAINENSNTEIVSNENEVSNEIVTDSNTFSLNDWIYSETNNGEIILSQYIGNSSEIIIPGIINERVVRISSGILAYIPKSKLTSITFQAIDGNKSIFPSNCSRLFKDFSNLKNIDLSGADTSNVTNMNSMFMGCSSLTNLNLSGFDTSSVKDMKDMFSKCSSLTSLNLSSFNTSSVEDMSRMFMYCNNLNTLDLSSFDTSNVKMMYDMFLGCTTLTSINLSSFNTSNVTWMNSMFSGCSNLTNLDLSNFNTYNVTYFDSMFKDCSSLTSLNLSNFNTPNATFVDRMFSGCSNLTSLDLSNFDTSNVAFIDSMFMGCSSLTNLDLSSFHTPNVGDMSNMFFGCSSLTNLDLSNFDTSNVKNMSNMFSGCSSLTSLDLSSFDASSVTYMSNMFYTSNKTPLLILTSDENLINYNYEEDNRISYWLIFNANHGNFKDDLIEKKVNIPIAISSLADNIEIIETPTRDGYEFVGWSTTKEENDSKTKNSDLNTLVDKLNKTYYAMWKKINIAPTINTAPTITASDKVLILGDKFDPLEGVIAYDEEDGEIQLTESDIIKNTVNMMQAGTYEVTYKVTDSQGASSIKTITVTIKNKEIVEDNQETDNNIQNDLTNKLPETGVESTLPYLGFLSLALGAILSFRKNEKK